MRLTHVEFQGFRAFGSTIAFDTASDVVVLVGPNGAGKTSFFDGLEWALFGSIRRLPATRDAVGQDYIRNQFTPNTTPSVSLSLSEGETAVAIRRTDRGVVVAEADRELVGKEANAWLAKLVLPSIESGATSPLDAFERTYLLGQERIVDFVRDTNPRDRFDSLSTLLGADVARRFYTRIANWQRTVQGTSDTTSADLARADRTLEELRLRRLGLESRAARLASMTLQRLWEAVGSVITIARPLGVSSRTNQTTGIEPLVSLLHDLESQTRSLQSRAVKAENQMQGLEGAQKDINDLRVRRVEVAAQAAAASASKREAQARATEVAKRLRDLQARAEKLSTDLQALRRDRLDYIEFLKLARDHVHTNECPVCGQRIIPAAVRDRLTVELDRIPEEEQRLASSESKIRSEKRDLDLENAEATNRLRDATRRSAQAASELSAVDRRIEGWEADVRDLISQWASADLRGVRVAVERTKRDLAKLLDELEVLIGQADTLIAKTELDSLESSMAQTALTRKTTADRLATIGRVAATLDSLASDSKELEISVVQGSIARQLPALRAVYRRLNPHPLFDSLDVTFGSFAERGEVYYRVSGGGASGNASMLFSSAQLNAVAVSVFVSLNLLRPKGGLDILLLDDPIQNMDDYNVLGLVDLMRNLRPHRQLFIATHDVGIGDLIRRKLRPREAGQRTVVHRFTSTDERGPHVLSTVDEYAAPVTVFAESA